MPRKPQDQPREALKLTLEMGQHQMLSRDLILIPSLRRKLCPRSQNHRSLLLKELCSLKRRWALLMPPKNWVHLDLSKRTLKMGFGEQLSMVKDQFISSNMLMETSLRQAHGCMKYGVSKLSHWLFGAREKEIREEMLLWNINMIQIFLLLKVHLCQRPLLPLLLLRRWLLKKKPLKLFYLNLISILTLLFHINSNHSSNRTEMAKTREKISLRRTLISGFMTTLILVWIRFLLEEPTLRLNQTNTGWTQLLLQPLPLSKVLRAPLKPPLDFQRNSEVLSKSKITGTHMLTIDTGTTSMIPALSVCTMTKLFTVRQEKLERYSLVQSQERKPKNNLLLKIWTTGILIVTIDTGLPQWPIHCWYVRWLNSL